MPLQLTQHLLSHSPAAGATITPFTTAAGDGTLSHQTLSTWLASDVVYTRAYVRFIGSLLTKLDLPHTTSSGPSSPAFEIFNLLVFALTNIQTEMKFFDQVREEFGLLVDSEADLGKAERDAGAYVDFFEQVGTKGSLGEGLVVLWATEHCYFEAWSHAKRVSATDDAAAPQFKSDKDAQAHAALRERFIPNWSSPEFKDFVGRCADLLDRASEQGQVETRRAEGLWDKVLELEREFWPAV